LLSTWRRRGQLYLSDWWTAVRPEETHTHTLDMSHSHKE